MKIYNTITETSLRIILNLSECNTFKTQDEIIISDFFTIYGKDFYITPTNLHGTSPLKVSEFKYKKQLIKDSLKELVLDAFLEVKIDDAIRYKITNKGNYLASNLNTTYSDEYRNIVKLAYSKISNYSISELYKEITRVSLRGTRI